MELKDLVNPYTLIAGTAIGLFMLHQRMTVHIGVWNAPLTDMTKVGKVTILMPTLNEAQTLECTLESLQNQNVRAAYPGYFEVVVVDSNSDDDTVDIAQEMGARVVTSPPGKLSAIDYALAQVDGNVIVAVDGDSYYNVNFLNLLLSHFQNPNVVGASGVELYDKPFPAVVGLLFENNVNPLRPRMMGRGCAYRRAAYYASGGFNLNIDQKDLLSMVNEEEYGYWSRLSKVGKCIRDTRISVLTSDRRLQCSGCAYDQEAEQCQFCTQVQSGERF